MMLLNRRWTSLAIQFFTLFCLNATWAQTYPTKPISMVVAVSPGGATDIAARLVASKLSERLGQPVIVENRPGAAQSIGSEFVAKSPADGYTLIMGTVSSHAINAPLYRNLRYSIANDFVAISQVTSQPLLLVVHPTVPANSVTELLQLLKANPDKYSYGSAGGVGTSGHMSAELFEARTGIQMQHVPYKGSTQAMNDVLSGLVPVMFSPASSVLPHINSGKVVALATTSNRRTPLIAVPTLEEVGVTNFNVSLWFGILAPKGTDSQIVNKLSNAIVSALDDPETKKLLAAQTMDIVKADPVEFKAFINSEIIKWGVLIKSNKIDLN